MANLPLELPPDALRRACPCDTFEFDTTQALPPLTGVLGQPRAVAALEFGSSIAAHGFNLFALGQPRSGKTTLIREFLEQRAAELPVPDDLCFVFNFADQRRPLPLQLPAGRGAAFRDDVATLVTDLQEAIPRAFETEEYVAQRDRIVAELDTQRQQELTRLDKHIQDSGFRLLKGPGGLAIVPFVNEKPLTEKDLASLSEEERAKVDRVRERLQREVEEKIRAVREMEKASREAIRRLDTETASFAINHLINDLRSRYQDLPAVLAYLDALRQDVLSNIDDFRKGKEETPALPFPLPLPVERPFVRYRVNLVVDNSGLKSAPVVVETNPTYHNLTGRIEHHATMGGVFTDHTMIKAGALHRANGGFLAIPARECLMNPFAWEALKRALKDSEVDIEELGSQLSLISTVTLDPQPVALKVKVVLIGSPFLYYLLSTYDEDFQKLFKVRAEFATSMDRTAETEREYALFVTSITRRENLPPFDRGAVARIVEFGSRLADDQEKISTQFGEIADLIREAAHHGRKNGAVTAADVRMAEEARRYRKNLTEERLREGIRNGMLLLETSGTAVGRINGLSVLGLGDYAFGHPARLTATVAPGRRGVVSIEREVELSGPIHGKGVLILNGYLLKQYGSAGSLNLSASLVFEQSYGMVEGDSASLAELCVLLSALSEIPLRQDIAVTGSVNQHGQVQPVGGVSEKIEGFFDACRERGLTGSQGVMIPLANRRSLMLRDDVVEASRSGQFRVYAAETVDQALELLTGLPAAEVHQQVAAKLGHYVEALQEERGPRNRPAGAPQPPGNVF